jgi:hypothetical protein
VLREDLEVAGGRRLLDDDRYLESIGARIRILPRAAVNQVDLRSTPAYRPEGQIARLPTPDTGRLSLSRFAPFEDDGWSVDGLHVPQVPSSLGLRECDRQPVPDVEFDRGSTVRGRNRNSGHLPAMVYQT